LPHAQVRSLDALYRALAAEALREAPAGGGWAGVWPPPPGASGGAGALGLLASYFEEEAEGEGEEGEGEGAEADPPEYLPPIDEAGCLEGTRSPPPYRSAYRARYCSLRPAVRGHPAGALTDPVTRVD
jgi:hypothetical protein